ncbi:MAG: nitrate reductase molybdenum cofactor assembly chaperone [Bauldia sp.]
MARTFKALSALLSYPSRDLQAAMPELAAAIDGEALLPSGERIALAPLFAELATGDLLDLEERYVLLFDRTRSLSLNLFEHVHGESRDRGQAMVDLKQVYERSGLKISVGELPDYLPLFLEYLSTIETAEAQGLLGQARGVIAALGERLEKRGSAYARVFDGLLALAASAPAAEDVPIADGNSDPDDFAALDASWEEAGIAFGPEAAPSGRDRLVAQMRAAKRRPAVAKEYRHG